MTDVTQERVGTEAGRRLLEREDLNSRSFALITPEAIAAIEAEARRAALDEAIEAVDRLPWVEEWEDCHAGVRAALAALREQQETDGE